MDLKTLEKINSLNREFYSEHASEFSKTRAKIQPGVQRLLPLALSQTSILDVGCGNGTFASALLENGYTGKYLGLDFSQTLLKDAQKHTLAHNFAFQAMDITKAWPTLSAKGYGLAVSFAVLHHIAGQDQRISLLRNIRHHLTENGHVIISAWQFLNSSKLAARVLPWESVGIEPEAVDEGDYMLDWRSGERGLRYAHLFSAEDLVSLAAETGFTVKDSFLSDGSSGNLGLYQVWQMSNSDPIL